MRAIALIMLFTATLLAGWLLVGSIYPAHAAPL
jgi:hypothetical protein